MVKKAADRPMKSEDVKLGAPEVKLPVTVVEHGTWSRKTCASWGYLEGAFAQIVAPLGREGLDKLSLEYPDYSRVAGTVRRPAPQAPYRFSLTWQGRCCYYNGNRPSAAA